MRRPWILCSLCLLLCAIAWAITVPGGAGQASARTSEAAQASVTGSVLLGDTAVEPGLGRNRAGVGEAVPFVALASGTLTSIRIYVGSHNAARVVAAGIYATKHGHPGRRVASGHARPKAGSWIAVKIGATAIISGDTYWLAVLGTGGALSLRDRAKGPCVSDDARQSSLGSLPAAWASGRRSHACPVSVYGTGRLAPSQSPGTPPTTTGATPCALTAAAEACWASHTGVPGYTETQILAGQSPLTHVTGDVTVTTSGAVIADEWIDGCVAVDANNVTIKDSLIHTQDGCSGGDHSTAASALNDGSGSSVTGLVIEDTEVDGMNGVGDAYGVSGDNYVCLRCNVHGFAKNLAAGNAVRIQDSYSHDLTIHDECVHSSPVYADSGTNVTVEHSYLIATGTSSGCVTAAFMNGGSYGPPSTDTIDHSFLDGESGADMLGACGSTDIHVTDNAFSRNNGYGGTDYVHGFNDSDAGNAWSGNYVPELAGEPAPPPTGDPGNGNC
jgi:hypothetical protein